MNDAALEETVNAYLPAILDAGHDEAELKKQLMYLVKDVSRETRHEAFGLAQQHANAIMNMC